MRYFVARLALVVLLLLSFLPSPAQSSSAISQAVDAFVADKLKTLGIPGLAVAVVQKGEIRKVATYGLANVEWKAPVTDHTNFQIASCTKLLTSTLVLKTVYAGKLRLNDPISNYLDSIPPQWQPIRVKHLLTHASGIRDFHGNLYLSTAAVVRALRDSTLAYPPGSKQQYAQADFMLLGYILEKIYGKPFPELLQEEVTRPLQMLDGAFDMEQRVGPFLRTNLVSQKATTYYDWQGQLRAYKYLYPAYTYTAGGYFASLHDMVQWAIGLDKEVLFPEAFAAPLLYGCDSLPQGHAEFTRAGWALGTEKDIVSAGHSGGPGLGDVWRFPQEGYTVIVLSNDGELLPGLARAIAAFYIKGLSPGAPIKKYER
ncbi:serine hydrolase domain-containing protein [Hymenobacter sp. GOD-10R]|uniref:serine hydrolase domain-containing protein n=1 Tax=Hymenobacter sp. GOD-10R TaxID=3093922 RepID=UPI002D77AA2E|nr:serine hydrolase domain-containing protein [Hymenobacter sp. GOD-10R]WRQ26917.1 serine hydrolase domain-containing protein [Hymenobacter sp. GOD-10R]